MRRSSITTALIMLLVSIISCALLTPKAQAASPCTSTVYDGTTRKLLQSDASSYRQLQRVAEGMDESINADVHIILVDSVPSRNIEAYVNRLILTCPQWHTNGPDGTPMITSDLMVFTYSITGGKTAGLVDVRIGTDFFQALQYTGDYERVIDAMVPDLLNTQYADAFLKGMNKAEQLVMSYNSRGRYQQKPWDPPTSTDTVHEPINWWPWIYAGIGALVLCVIGVVAWLIIRENRRRKSAQLLIDQRYTDARERMDSLSTFETNLDVDISEAVVKRSVDDSINGQLVKLDTAFGEARTKVSEALTECEVAIPVSGWRAKPYTQMAEQLARTLDLVEKAEGAQAAYATYLEDVQKRIASAPDDHAELVPEPDRLTALAAQRADEGYLFDSVAPSVDNLAALIQTAGQEIQAGSSGQAIDEIERAQGLVTSITAVIERGPQARVRIEAAVARLRERISATRGEAGQVKEHVARISREYGSRCTQTLASNVTINDHVTQAYNRLVDAARSGSMDFQQWDQADTELANAQKHVDTADRQIDDVRQTETAMQVLRASLTRDIASAARDADREKDNMAFRKGFQSSYRSSLDTAITALNRLDPSHGDLLDTRDAYKRLESDVRSAVRASESEHARKVAADAADAAQKAALATNMSVNHTTPGGGYNPPNLGGGGSRSL